MESGERIIGVHEEDRMYKQFVCEQEELSQ